MEIDSDSLCTTTAAELCLKARVGLIWDGEFCLQIKLEQALEESSDLPQAVQ